VQLVEMRRRVIVVWTTVALLALLLVVPKLAAASQDEEETESVVPSSGKTEDEEVPKNLEEEDDDDWEDIEDDDEVGLAAASSRSASRMVKALPKVTDSNADRILSSTEYILLMGYASWCKQSAKVMIDFAEAATALASLGSPVILVKVDAIANPVTASRFNIKGYPTILFLRNGSSEMYQAGQTR
jgi:thiol-disulfide isomerase/thioredoxin